MRIFRLFDFITLRSLSLFVLLACFTFTAGFSQIVVKGTVKNSAGETWPGVNVYIEGTQTGTITDLDGNYEITVPDETSILVFSYVGYLQESIAVGSQTTIDVVMSEDLLKLDEVVVIGYGTQKKSDLTGAITSVDAEDLEKTNSSNIMSALQGKAAGLQISPSTGMPGSETYMRIRGVSSISQINDDQSQRQKTLWIVDGVPMDAKSVNPADIESMEILKDASTGAIYGTAASNGVILVTTKKGSNSGKPKAELNYYRGWNSMPRKVDVLDGPQFADMNNQLNIIANSKLGKVDRTTVVDLYDPDTMLTYDYQDLLFRTAMSQNIDFSISGGNEKMTSYFSLGYNDEEGILENQDYKRVLSRLNLDFNVSKWLKFGNNLSFRWEQKNGVPEWRFFDEYNSPVNTALLFAPFQQPYIDGAHPDTMWSTNPISNVSNPMLIPDLTHQQQNNYSGDVTLFAIINPFKGLSFESRFSGNMNYDDFMNADRTYFFSASTNNNSNKLQKRYGKGYGYTIQDFITYSTTFLDMINASAMIGFEASQSKYNQLYLGVGGLAGVNDEALYFGSSTDIREYPVENAKEYRGYAYFGRISLDYKSMILLQGNIRRDASSVFGPKNPIGTFPGYSAGFKFTELDYFKNFSWLSFGKIRYGWGRCGNNPLQPYTYYSLIGEGSPYANFQYSFDNSAITYGAAPINLPNTAIKWETIETTNIGLDLSLFKNKLTFTFERFVRKNIDMIWTPQIVGFAGWWVTPADVQFENNNVNSEPYANIGQISSRGFELTIGYKSSIGKLKYDVSGNFTYVKNKADDLKGNNHYGGSSSRPGGDLVRTVEGGEIGEFYGFKIVKMYKPADCDTLYENLSTNVLRPRWGKVVVATNQPIKEVVSSFVGVNPRTGDSVFRTLSHLDTVYVQDKAQPGDFQFLDANGDGVLNSEDYQPLGNPFAPYLVGLDINLEYGWFDLSMTWYGSFGNEIFNTRRGQLYNSDGQSNWSVDYYENYYRDAIYDREGNLVLAARDGEYPRLDRNGVNQNLAYPSEFFIENGSFVKLRSIQIGVTIPEKYTKTIGLASVRVYVGGRNLLTITKYSGIDPEIELRNPLVAGIDKGGYPIPRAFNAGISVKF